MLNFTQERFEKLQACKAAMADYLQLWPTAGQIDEAVRLLCEEAALCAQAARQKIVAETKSE